MFKTQHRSTILFLTLTALFLYFHLFRFPAVPILFEGDHAVHLSNAWRLFQGEVPFRDFFMFTFPGTEFYYLLLFKLFGVQIWLLNATIFLLLFGLSAVGLFFSRRLLDDWAVYLPVSIFLIIGFRPLGIDGSHRFFSVLAVLCAVAVLFTKRTPLRLFLAGTLCGLASTFTQPRGLVGIAAVVVFLFFEKIYTNRSLSVFIRAALWTIIPFALIISFISIYFIAAAGFDTFYFSTFVFPVKHYPADVWNNPGAYLRDVPVYGSISRSLYLRQTPPVLLNYLLIPLIYPLSLLVLWFKRLTVSNEQKLRLVFLNLTGLFLAFGVFSAPTATRFYQISLPGLILLIWIVQKLFNIPKIILAFSALLGLLGVTYTVQRQRVPVYGIETPSGFAVSLSSENLSRYRWIADQTRPDDYLYEPHHPSLYWIFRLKNPTPMPLIRPNNYTTAEQVDEILAGLNRHPPKYIIWNGLWENYPTGQTPDFHLAPLVNFLHTNYHRISALDNFSDMNNQVEYQVEIWEKNQD